MPCTYFGILQNMAGGRGQDQWGSLPFSWSCSKGKPASLLWWETCPASSRTVPGLLVHHIVALLCSTQCLSSQPFSSLPPTTQPFLWPSQLSSGPWPSVTPVSPPQLLLPKSSAIISRLPHLPPHFFCTRQPYQTCHPFPSSPDSVSAPFLTRFYTLGWRTPFPLALLKPHPGLASAGKAV